VSNGRARESENGSARLPLTLLLLTVAGLAGLLLWLTFVPPSPTVSPPSVKISLGVPAAESTVAPQPEAPVPPAAQPATPAPATPQPTASPEPKPSATTREPPRPTPSAPVPAAPQLSAAVPGQPLGKVPDPGLIEPSRHGSLPIVGRDGREAWRVYARPFDQTEKRPRIAMVLHGLGMDADATRTAIRKLPGEVSLAFAPYADGLDRWVAEARAAGHEALIMVPMESVDFPISDPGPRALMTTLTAEQNVDRLEWVLARAAGCIGITDYLGTRFTRSRQHMETLFRELRKRGLLFLAGRRETAGLVQELATPMRLPFVVSTLHIDERATRSLIDAQLLELERLAGSNGRSVGMGLPYPITVERLVKWADGLASRGFVLAPVSALATREGS